MQAIICDDDNLLRHVIRSVVEAAGHTVAGEAEDAPGAGDLIRRLAPAIVVLDLALAAGQGDTLIAQALAANPRSRVLVFSAFASDPEALVRAGAAAVVLKPRFDELESILRDWASDAPVERRRQRRPSTGAGAARRSPTGLEGPSDFYPALAASQPGDLLLAFTIADGAALARQSGDAFAMDWLLLLARVVRAVLRHEDRLSCLDGRTLHALVVDGGAEGVGSILHRVELGWLAARAGEALRLITGLAIQDGDMTAEDLLLRARPE